MACGHGQPPLHPGSTELRSRRRHQGCTTPLIRPPTWADYHNILSLRRDSQRRPRPSREPNAPTIKVRQPASTYASMTTVATRSPLSILHNPYTMSETRNGRRTSARIADKDEAPSINGLGKTSQTRENTAEKPAKHNRPTTANDVAKGGRGKRKQGVFEVYTGRFRLGVNMSRSADEWTDYDEESDGFVFTRTRAKKTKVAEAPKEQPIPEAQEEPALAPPKKPRRRSRVSAGVVAEGKPEVPKKAGRPPRRSARNSGGSTNDDPPPLEVKKKRTRKSDLDEDESRGRSKPGQDDRENVTLQIAKSSEISKIALPFADTPIIRRNKAMRAESGQRRSSLGNRGRRASSLIDSGRSSGELGLLSLSSFHH